MISICLPTRNRAALFKRFCTSVLRCADKPNDIEFSIYRDEDDTSEYEYFGNYKLIVGKRIWPDPSFNEAQKNATGPIYLYATDDTEFISNGWDTLVRNAFDESKDKIIFAMFNDGVCRSNYAVVGAVHKNWIDTVGYFFDPRICRRGDVTINRWAKALNRKAYLREARIRFIPVIDDKTHLEYDEEIKRSKNLELYRSKELTEERKQAQKRLEDYIRNHS